MSLLATQKTLFCYGWAEQRGILSVHALVLSFDEGGRWCAPGQSEHSNSRQLSTNGGANKLVFPFVCTNYCKRDGKCRKVEARVHDMWEKVSKDFIPYCTVKHRLGSLFWFTGARENIGRHL